jgi:hypothetical protein
MESFNRKEKVMGVFLQGFITGFGLAFVVSFVLLLILDKDIVNNYTGKVKVKQGDNSQSEIKAEIKKDKRKRRFF